MNLLGPVCVFAASLTLAAPAFAHGTQCSDATAKNTYTASPYDGGFPLPAQDISNTETAQVNGVALGTNTYSEAAGWQSTFTASVSVQSDLGTVSDRGNNQVTHTYVATLTLAAIGAAPSFEGLVICADTSFLIPPP